MKSKIFNIMVPFFAYILFFLFLSNVYFHSVCCPFEKNISEVSVKNMDMATEEYIYSIENSIVDENDLFRIAQISGWIVKRNEASYMPLSAELILASNDMAYRIILQRKERKDIWNLKRSDKKYMAGYCATFPSVRLDNGDYTIGFIVNENNREAVLWTDEKISISGN